MTIQLEKLTDIEKGAGRLTLAKIFRVLLMVICPLAIASSGLAQEDRGGNRNDRHNEQGTCTQQCANARNPALCERRCIERTYDQWARRAEIRERRSIELSNWDRVLDIRQNPDYTIQAKSALKRQVHENFEQFNLSNEVLGPPLPPSPLQCQVISPFNVRSSLPPIVPLFGNSQPPNVGECQGRNCELPNPFDVPTPWVHVKFSLDALSNAQADDFIDPAGPDFMKVYLNDSEMTQGSLAQEGADVLPIRFGCNGDNSDPQCLLLTFRGDTWWGPHSPPWPDFDVRVELWRQAGRVSEKVSECEARLKPPSTYVSYWLLSIGSIVTNSRCTTCHSMDTASKINTRHGFDVEPKKAPSTLHPSTQQIYSLTDYDVSIGKSCNVCHGDPLELVMWNTQETFEEEAWATPTVPQNIDWAQLLNNNPNNWPSVICNRMTTNLPTHAKRAEHFHEDVRLAWAVAGGELPYGALPPSVPTAPPHNYSDFIRMFDAWNDAGAPCP